MLAAQQAERVAIATGLLSLLVWAATSDLTGICPQSVLGLDVLTAALLAVPPERAGAAGAIAGTSNELGNALGISPLGATAALVFRLSGPDVAGTLNETLAVPGLAEGAAESARAAFLSGMHVAVVIGSAASFAVGLLILRLVPRAARVSQAAPASRSVR
ncbi:hypothetical protein [Nocardiopsis metallicus]|uniref:MFS transporter n=1 Tax=Nocardiopsis metallicus TaxID=179819 RepID=A0A840WN75_9ACTN|nr:hypothetical protein [Nocardiopsis metallicus]MBB5491578.1 hypothetical protein [Nocardiopsis metallicus]